MIPSRRFIPGQAVRLRERDRAIGQLGTGDEKTAAVIEDLTRVLVTKLLNDATFSIRSCAETGDLELADFLVAAIIRGDKVCIRKDDQKVRGKFIQPLFKETTLSVTDLVAPLFIDETIGNPEAIVSMPGQFRYPVSMIAGKAGTLYDSGVHAVLLFGVPARKDNAQRITQTGLSNRL